MLLEEQNVNTDHGGDEHKHAKHDGFSSSHGARLSAARLRSAAWMVNPHPREGAQNHSLGALVVAHLIGDLVRTRSLDLNGARHQRGRYSV